MGKGRYGREAQGGAALSGEKDWNRDRRDAERRQEARESLTKTNRSETERLTETTAGARQRD